jgi:glycerol-3-phosphate dehydrogenase
MEGFNDSKELAGIYTVAIIGGGAIGCAILRQLTLSGIECILLEKEDTILGGASAGLNYCC